MSYPEPTYLAADGEASATFRPVTTPPDLDGATGAVHYLATGARTAGGFGLYRWSMSGVPSGPDPHFHRTISESFFVLSGTVRIYDGTRWLDTVAGDFVHVPAGGVHAFRNVSGAPADMLLLFAPGAPREAYFETLAGWAAEGRRPGADELAELWARHDQYPVEGVEPA